MNQNVPFQVESVIKSLLDQKENIYIRSNYRQRLDVIREEISKAIELYDKEFNIEQAVNRHKKRQG